MATTAGGMAGAEEGWGLGTVSDGFVVILIPLIHPHRAAAPGQRLGLVGTNILKRCSGNISLEA